MTPTLRTITLGEAADRAEQQESDSTIEDSRGRMITQPFCLLLQPDGEMALHAIRRHPWRSDRIVSWLSIKFSGEGGDVESWECIVSHAQLPVLDFSNISNAEE